MHIVCVYCMIGEKISPILKLEAHKKKHEKLACTFKPLLVICFVYVTMWTVLIQNKNEKKTRGKSMNKYKRLQTANSQIAANVNLMRNGWLTIS